MFEVFVGIGVSLGVVVLIAAAYGLPKKDK
jgi:hypothetical protein